MKPETESSELDPALERAWRAHSRESPSPELDRAILAAAHRAAGSGPRDALKPAAEATRPQRWWMSLAAAATIGVIALGILQLTPLEDDLVASDERVADVVRHGASAPPPPRVERENKADTAKPAAQAAEPPPLSVATDSGKYDSAQKKQRDEPRGGAARSADNVIAQAPAAEAPASTGEERAAVRKDVVDERHRFAQSIDKAHLGRDGRLEGRFEGNEAIGQAAAVASPPPMLARKAASLDDLRAHARDPDAWIVRIRKLRDAGDTAEALRELREFRNLVPDADRRLPADLLAWANTFKS